MAVGLRAIASCCNQCQLEEPDPFAVVSIISKSRTSFANVVLYSVV